MSFFSGYRFFILLIIMLMPAVVLGMTEKMLKPYRWFVSLFFIVLVYMKTPLELFYLIGYIGFSIGLVKIYTWLRTKYGRNKIIYKIILALVLLPLIVYKISSLFGFSICGFLGISYICFRVLQVVIEIYDGVIKEINLFQFTEFLIFFPSLSSGPIDRSRRFNEDDNRRWLRKEYVNLLYNGTYKLILGMFYKIACSGIFFYIMKNYFYGKKNVLFIIGYAYMYGLYLFFDFAGYSAMAVGTSYILGIRVPDNFNKPFLSVDIKDFWNRWHITLSTWFRDFVFTRFMVESARKKRFSNRLTGAVIGLIMNMTIMGIWHGLDIQYIIYGIYHGCLMAIVEVYQKKSKFYKKYKKENWYLCCSWFININAVMFGFMIFSGYFTQIFEKLFQIYF